MFIFSVFFLSFFLFFFVGQSPSWLVAELCLTRGRNYVLCPTTTQIELCGTYAISRYPDIYVRCVSPARSSQL